MKFSSSFLLTVIALLGTSSGSDTQSQVPEDQVEGASGCSKGGNCWGSCKVDELGDSVPDKETAWEEGRPWCWIQEQNTMDMEMNSIPCDWNDTCSLGWGYYCYDNACIIEVD